MSIFKTRCHRRRILLTTTCILAKESAILSDRITLASLFNDPQGGVFAECVAKWLHYQCFTKDECFIKVYVDLEVSKGGLHSGFRHRVGGLDRGRDNKVEYETEGFPDKNLTV